MQRMASILTGLSLAVLFFAASAHARSEERMTANIPFDFTVGSISLPAGQYQFLGTGDNFVQVRGADLRSVFTLSSASMQANGLTEKSMLKFATVDGHHALVQIWDEFAGRGNEFPYGHNAVELAKPATVDGAVRDRR
jgi:hypothetical protein